jgi:hypothetical protein
MRDPLALIRQTPAPLIEIGRAMPPIPCFPDADEPPRWFKVTPTAGVPAVLFRRDFTDVLAVPADEAAFGLRPERVPASGFACPFVFAPAGTFFDGRAVTARPDRGAEPFALVLGVVATDPGLALWVDRWPAATAAVGIASAATSPTMSRIFFISVSFLETWVGWCNTSGLGRAVARAQMTLVIASSDGCPDRSGSGRGMGRMSRALDASDPSPEERSDPRSFVGAEGRIQRWRLSR